MQRYKDITFIILFTLGEINLNYNEKFKMEKYAYRRNNRYYVMSGLYHEWEINLNGCCNR